MQIPPQKKLIYSKWLCRRSKPKIYPNRISTVNHKRGVWSARCVQGSDPSDLIWSDTIWSNLICTMKQVSDMIWSDMIWSDMSDETGIWSDLTRSNMSDETRVWSVACDMTCPMKRGSDVSDMDRDLIWSDLICPMKQGTDLSHQIWHVRLNRDLICPIWFVLADDLTCLMKEETDLSHLIWYVRWNGDLVCPIWSDLLVFYLIWSDLNWYVRWSRDLICHIWSDLICPWSRDLICPIWSDLSDETGISSARPYLFCPMIWWSARSDLCVEGTLSRRAKIGIPFNNSQPFKDKNVHSYVRMYE